MLVDSQAAEELLSEENLDAVVEELLTLRRGSECLFVAVRLFAPTCGAEPMCRLEFDGIPPVSLDVTGVTALHALAVAVGFVQLRLQHHEEDGWAIFLRGADGEEPWTSNYLAGMTELPDPTEGPRER